LTAAAAAANHACPSNAEENDHDTVA
jgi:hypothetical protein